MQPIAMRPPTFVLLPMLVRHRDNIPSGTVPSSSAKTNESVIFVLVAIVGGGVAVVDGNDGIDDDDGR